MSDNQHVVLETYEPSQLKLETWIQALQARPRGDIQSDQLGELAETVVSDLAETHERYSAIVNDGTRGEAERAQFLKRYLPSVEENPNLAQVDRLLEATRANLEAQKPEPKPMEDFQKLLLAQSLREAELPELFDLVASSEYLAVFQSLPPQYFGVSQEHYAELIAHGENAAMLPRHRAQGRDLITAREWFDNLRAAHSALVKSISDYCETHAGTIQRAKQADSLYDLS